MLVVRFFISAAVMSLIKNVSCSHNTLDILLSWKQENAIDYHFNCNLKLVSVNRIQPTTCAWACTLRDWNFWEV